ncbi:MAG: stage II sporulation protein M [Chloroflexota bacterium]
MKADQLYQSRQTDWQNLSELIAKSRNGVSQLTPAQIEKLGVLYRSATSDLAIAQRDFPNDRITAYINQLVAQAHMIIYRQEPFSWRRIINFISTGLPNAYRKTLPYTITAAMFFILPALLAAVALSIQPGAADQFLPPEVSSLSETIANKELWTNIPIEERPYASSFIMTNNIQVSFLAFSAGILFGIFTIWIMVYNGLILGGLTGLTIHYGIGFDLWTFVIGHGVIEMSVIFITGGCGLMLGWAALRPGLLSRKNSIMIAARRAIRLVIGLIPFLILAGLIEGFISPNEQIWWQVKWAIGIGASIVMHVYLLFYGRKKTECISA